MNVQYFLMDNANSGKQFLVETHEGCQVRLLDRIV